MKEQPISPKEFRLSPQQRQLWELQQTFPRWGYYAQCAVLIEGDLDTELLTQALARVIDRHEILHANFRALPEAAIAVQVINGASPPRIQVLSLPDSNPARLEDEVAALLEKERKTAFNLESDPPLRLSLIKLSVVQNLLLIGLPALCADAATMKVLVKEISQCYASCAKSEDLAEGPLQYVDLAEWQNRLLEAEDTKSGRDYWRTHFSSPPQSVKSIIRDHPAESGTSQPQVYSLQIEPAVTDAIKTTALELGISESAFFFTCWRILLWQLSEQQAITVALACDGRKYQELEEALGLFAKHLPIKCDFNESTRFTDALKSTDEQAREAYKWQEYFSFDRDDFDDEAGFNFFPLCFEFLEPTAAHSSGGLLFSLLTEYVNTDVYDLKLFIVQKSDGLFAELNYAPDLFEAETIRRLASQFQSLLRNALHNLSARIVELDFLCDIDRRQLLDEFNRTQTDYPADKCIHDLFEEQAARTPDEVAVVFEGMQLTYESLNAAGNHLAIRLKELGVGRESIVGVCVERSPEMIVGILGILKAGAAYLPLDPVYPDERIAFILRDAAAVVTLTQKRLTHKLSGYAGHIVALDEDWQAQADGVIQKPEPGATPDNLAYVIYTSGSTGKPKGAMISHRGLVNYVSWAARAYPTEGGRGIPVHSSIAFDFTITSIFVPLITGNRIILCPESQRVEALANLLNSGTDFSFVKVTPAHLEILARLVDLEGFEKRVQTMIVGGEALWSKTVSLYKEHSPSTVIVNEYGPTETVVGCCVYEAPAGALISEAVPIGRPIANIQIYILNRELNPAPVGVAGEIYIGGEGLARGYLGSADLTAQKFIPNPFCRVPGERLYQTGDLGRHRNDGNIEFIGRTDEQLKIRGYRVEPNEIEGVIKEYPAVEECVVVAKTGHLGTPQLTAYYVRQDGYAVSEEELRNYVESRLPEYMWIGRYEELSEMPLNDNGKIDRKRLKARETAEATGRRVVGIGKREDEEILQGIWRQVLGVKQVGIDDKYFALGGDSIRSIQIVSLARERGFSISLDQIFKHQTIRELAQAIRESKGDAGEVAHSEPFSLITEDERRRLPADVEDAYPLTVLQAGMIYHMEMNPRSPIYHDVSSFHLKARLEVEKLETAVREVVQRHPMLRTTFDLSNFSEGMQLVHREGNVEIAVTDLRGMTEGEQGNVIGGWIEREKGQGFDIEKGPMLRIQLHLRDDEIFQFTLSFHHAILDGWSDASMLTELALTYVALLKGEFHAAEAPAALFRDYVALERQAIASKECERYWAEKLADSTFNSLPRWRNSTSENAEAGKMSLWCVPISDELSEALKALALANAVPVKSVLLAAHMKVIGLLTGQPIASTYLISSGRPETLDGDRVIGLFLNSLPFCLKLNGGAWVDLITAAFETERGSLPYRRYPMAELKRKQGGRALAETDFYFTHYHVYEGLVGLDGLEVLEHTVYEETNTVLGANFGLDAFSSKVYLNLWCNIREFSQPQIELMGGYFLKALEAMTRDPYARYDTVSLLSESEMQRLLVEWNGAKTEVEDRRCLHEIFEEQARAGGDRIALVCGDAQISYGELDQRANRLARRLRRMGVRPEKIVGVLMSRREEVAVAILGILKSGGAYLPVDEQTPQARMELMLKEAGVEVVITEEKLKEKVQGAGVKVIEIEREEEEEAEGSGAVEGGAGGQNAAYVIYTSGTTGKPKGVVVTHDSIVSHCLSVLQLYDLKSCDRVLQFYPFGFDASLEQTFAALISGATLIIRGDEVWSAIDFAEVLEAGVTVVDLPTAYWDQLVQAWVKAPELFTGYRLRLMIVGGERMSPESLRLWRRTPAHSIRLLNAYGPTEATITSTVLEVDAETDYQNIPIGFPLTNRSVYVVDSDRQLSPIGVAGELLIGGAGVARGYLDSPDLTAVRFVPDPFCGQPGARLFATGDLARRLIDSQLEFLGRKDRQVKIRGFRVEPGEVEAVLLQHPDVREAVVLAGNKTVSDLRLVGYAALHPEKRIAIGVLYEYLEARLPQYMLPSCLILLDELPRTSSGKLDIQALPEPEGARSKPSSSYSPPSTPAEEVLSQIWAEMLGLERIGVRDDFFELGGHSILALQLIVRIREAFQVDLPLRRLYDAPTIAGLAAEITQQKGRGQPLSALPQLESYPDERFEPFPMTSVQQAYWIGRSDFFDLGQVGSHLYIELDFASLDISRFNLAWQKLIARHEMLRAVTLPDGRQKILQEVPPFQIEILDLRDQDPQVVATELEAMRDRLSHQFLSTDQWPLFEVHASLLEGENARLHFSFEGLMADAWSLRILNRELVNLYQNPELELESMEISFRDYVLAEIAARESAEYRRAYNYWISRIPSLPPAPELPLAANPASVISPRFVRRRGRLEAEQWKKLRSRAGRAGLTSSGVLLAAFSDVLANWSKSPKFTINLTLFNRPPIHPQINQVVGDFTSLTFLEVDFSAVNTFEERARRLMQQLMEDLDHHQFGGVEVIREIGRNQPRTTHALMPVVFTSTLNMSGLEGEAEISFLRGEEIYSITQTPQVWLDHQVFEQDGALVFNWDAVEALFPGGLLDQMFAAYRAYLSRLAEEDQSWKQTSRDLTPAADLRQRAAINATAWPHPDHLLHTMFAAQAQRRPEQPAVISGQTTLSYDQLYRLSNRIGRRLRRGGAEVNELVGIVMQRGWQQVAGVLGTLASGAAYLPIEAGLPEERIKYLLKDGQVRQVLTQRQVKEQIAWPAGIEVICVDGDEMAGESDEWGGARQGSRDLAYVIYTSGTTGEPKGVMIEHRGAVNTILDINERFGVDDEDAVLGLSSLSFDLSVYDIFGILAAGGRLVMVEEESRRDPGEWMRKVKQEGVTIWNSVPAMMEMLMESDGQKGEMKETSLRVVMMSGDWIGVNLPERLKRAKPGVKVVSLGGATEASIWSVLYEVGEVSREWKSIPYGKPMRNQRLEVRNEWGEAAPMWVSGEISIGGEGVARGYWKDEERSGEKFRGGAEGGDREYRTGDLGRYQEDGNVELLGRKDDQVKVQGYRVELVEIEKEMMKEEEIKRAVVVMEGERGGVKRLVGYVEMEEGKGMRVEEVRERLRKRLPEYMIPTVYEPVREWPLSATGKVDRKALKSRVEHHISIERPMAPPSTPTEKTLAKIWADVLKIHNVSVHDDFFESGGDSLLAIQFHSKLRETYHHIDIPIRKLFSATTISELAPVIEAAFIEIVSDMTEAEARQILESLQLV